MFLNRLSRDSRQFKSFKRKEEKQKYVIVRAVKFLLREFFKSRCRLLRPQLSAEEAALFDSRDSGFAGAAWCAARSNPRLRAAHDDALGLKRLPAANMRAAGSAGDRAEQASLHRPVLPILLRADCDKPKSSTRILPNFQEVSSRPCLIPRSANPRVKGRKIQINAKTLKLLFSSQQFADDVTNYLRHFFLLESQGALNLSRQRPRLRLQSAQLAQGRRQGPRFGHFPTTRGATGDQIAKNPF